METFGKHIKIFSQTIRQKVARCDVENFMETGKVEPQINLRRVLEMDFRSAHHRTHFFAHFSFDALNTHVSVEHECGCIPFKTEHPLIAKDIISHPMTG